MDHQDLTVTVRTSTNTNGRNWQPFGYLVSKVNRHSFENNSEGTSVSHRLRVF